jgi:hypothetical protein
MYRTKLRISELPQDHLIFSVMMTSIGWHIFLVIQYFVWYFFQRRYNAKHFKDDPPNPRDSIASDLQLGDLDPRPSGPSDEVPLSPTQVSSFSISYDAGDLRAA